MQHQRPPHAQPARGPVQRLRGARGGCRRGLPVAGPVADDRCAMTNIEWVVDGPKLAEAFDIGAVKVINDFAAVGYGVLDLKDDEIVTLNECAAADARGPVAVLGPGTGLGEAMLFWNDERAEYDVVPPRARTRTSRRAARRSARSWPSARRPWASARSSRCAAAAASCASTISSRSTAARATSRAGPRGARRRAGRHVPRGEGGGGRVPGDPRRRGGEPGAQVPGHRGRAAAASRRAMAIIQKGRLTRGNCTRRAATPGSGRGSRCTSSSTTRSASPARRCTPCGNVTLDAARRRPRSCLRLRCKYVKKYEGDLRESSVRYARLRRSWQVAPRPDPKPRAPCRRGEGEGRRRRARETRARGPAVVSPRGTARARTRAVGEGREGHGGCAPVARHDVKVLPTAEGGVRIDDQQADQRDGLIAVLHKPKRRGVLATSARAANVYLAPPRRGGETETPPWRRSGGWTKTPPARCWCTDDGALSHRLQSPRKNVWKTYEVTLDASVPPGAVDLFATAKSSRWRAKPSRANRRGSASTRDRSGACCG